MDPNATLTDMGLEGVKRALLAQRVANAEHDFIEVISRALDLPAGLLARVFYAYEMLKNREGLSTEVPDWEGLLPDDDLRQAIQKAMVDGARRVRIAEAIRRGQTLTVRPEQLVPPNQKHKLCHGCPERIECTAGRLYTADECYSSRRLRLQVVPLRMTATELEVEAQQPPGRHTIPLKDISTRKERP